MQRTQAADPIQAAREYGLDLSLLHSALQRTPEERLRLAAENAACVDAIRGGRKGTDLPGILHALVQHEIRFILVGGLAAAAHGSPYVTTSLDLCYEAGHENVERLIAILNCWAPDQGEGPEWRLNAESLFAPRLIGLWTNRGVINLFLEVPGVGSFEACTTSSEHVRFGETELPVLGLDALIASERAMPPARSKGPLLALEALRVLRNC